MVALATSCMMSACIMRWSAPLNCWMLYPPLRYPVLDGESWEELQIIMLEFSHEFALGLIGILFHQREVACHTPHREFSVEPIFMLEVITRVVVKS